MVKYFCYENCSIIKVVCIIVEKNNICMLNYENRVLKELLSVFLFFLLYGWIVNIGWVLYVL